jgi:hypothetical protein
VQRLNPSLAALLESLAVRLGARYDDWSDAMLGQNYGAVPMRSGVPPGDRRGFNLLLLGRDGRPRHFAKCRPGEDRGLLDETALLTRIAADPRGKGHVVPAVAGFDARVTVQLAAFNPGELLAHYLLRVSAAALTTALVEILETAAQLGVIADGGTVAPPLDLMAEGEAPLQAAVRAGLEPARAERLASAMRAAGAVPSLCQHGDLWSANVLRASDGWLLIDFEQFGKLRVPMVDALQLSRATAEVRFPSHDVAWIGRLAEESAHTTFCRGVLGWARRQAGLSDQQALGAVAFGLLEITARFFSAGRSEPAWLPSLDSARAYADFLADEAKARHYLFGER